jgi:predicted nucleic acid-binding Zn finger protein
MRLDVVDTVLCQCKHILAARLAMALGKTRETEVSADAVVHLLR